MHRLALTVLPHVMKIRHNRCISAHKKKEGKKKKKVELRTEKADVLLWKRDFHNLEEHYSGTLGELSKKHFGLFNIKNLKSCLSDQQTRRLKELLFYRSLL